MELQVFHESKLVGLASSYIITACKGKIDPSNRFQNIKGGRHMQARRGSVVSKQEFIQDGLYAREEYEGLLVSSDEKEGCYNLGVQLAEDQVLFVDQATDHDIHQKLETWVPQIQSIQRQYNVKDNSGNYVK